MPLQKMENESFSLPIKACVLQHLLHLDFNIQQWKALICDHSTKLITKNKKIKPCLYFRQITTGHNWRFCCGISELCIQIFGDDWNFVMPFSSRCRSELQTLDKEGGLKTARPLPTARTAAWQSGLPSGQWRCEWRILPVAPSQSASLWCHRRPPSHRASSAHTSPAVGLGGRVTWSADNPQEVGT